MRYTILATSRPPITCICNRCMGAGQILASAMPIKYRPCTRCAGSGGSRRVPKAQPGTQG